MKNVGDFYVYVQAILWAIFPIITVKSFSSLDPVPSLALSTAFAALFFIGMVTWKRTWHEVWNWHGLKEILFIVLFIGVGWYSLVFIGLRYTTAGNASLIGLLEIFFSYLFFSVWKGEPFSAKDICGSALMLVGGVIVLLPNVTQFNIGDFLILLSAMIGPFGNYFQQRARDHVSSETIMLVRSLLSVPLLFMM